jgi:isocitrate dehydrogenase (NAD+)
MILSAVLMLRHLNIEDAANRLDKAVAAVLAEGRHRTADLQPFGEPARTQAVADAICAALENGP